MSRSVEVYWSFRSPYCYLAGPRLMALAKRDDVHVFLRPVYPLALRIEGYFKRQDPMARAYFFRDIARVAAFHGMPLTWPTPDPIQMSFETGEVFADQPYIHRLTRLGCAAERHGRGLDFVVTMSAEIFGGRAGWDDPVRMAEATAAAGLDLAALDAEIDADLAGFDAEIAANQDAHRAAGHWGVPLMVLDGEPFFGQDRIDLLAWRLRGS